MANSYNALKNQFFSILESLKGHIDKLSATGIATEKEVKEWNSYIGFAGDTFSDSRFRIAVVGSVKSGKSTLINALLGDDLLKRGAGIVTAFVTRVISDEKPEAVIQLKSLDQVDGEVRRIVKGLSGVASFFGEIRDFDIRRQKDREVLAKALNAFAEADLSHEGRRNLLLLKAYLEGYESLESVLKDQPVIKLKGSELVRHREYVGRESHAVYVRNVELRYPGGWIERDVEIADCQGSDAPNPLHYALLQEYLYTAHAIVYVISSRIGLREADFKLLEFIRSLSMMESTVFVLNVDMDVHPSSEDLIGLEERVRKELALFESRPQVFTFSALAELIERSGGSVSESRRLSLWKETTPELLKISNKGFSLFRGELTGIVARGKALVIDTGVTRARLVGASVLDFIRTRKSLLKGDFREKKQVISEIEKRQHDVVSAMNMLESMISGLRNSLVAECDKAIQKFFDLKYGPVVSDTVRMIENYRIEESFETRLKDLKGLITALYDFYIHFRADLARFVIDKVNVRIMTFAREQEDFVRYRLSEAARGFWSLLKVPLEDYRNALRGLGVTLTEGEELSMDRWSPSWNVSPPNFGLLADDYVLAKGVLYAKYGLGRMARLWNRLKKLLRAHRTDKEALLREDNLLEAVSLVKRQAREEVLYAFRDYRQNFRFGYVHRLIDEGIASLLREFTMRVETVKVNLERLEQLKVEEENKQHSLDALLDETESAVSGILEGLDRIRMEAGCLSPEAKELCFHVQASNRGEGR